MTQSSTVQAPSKGSGIKFKPLLYKLLRNWWLLLIGLALGYLAAKLYLRYRVVTYEVSAVIQIEEDKATGISEQVIVREFGYEDEQSLETEIQRMKSRSLLKTIVEELRLDVRFFTNGRVKNVDLYGVDNLPVSLTDEEVFPTAYGQQIVLRILGGGRFSFGNETNLDTFRIGVPFTNSFGTFIVNKNLGAPPVINEMIVQFQDPERVARSYASRLQINPISASNLLEMNLVDEVPERAADVIRGVIVTYDSITINERNQGTIKTIDFIDERIREFNRDLNAVEERAEDFIRNNNLLVDIPTNLQLQLDNLRSQESTLASLRLQLASVDNIGKYIQSSDRDYSLIPFSGEAANLDVGRLVEQYNTLLIEREELLSTAGPTNPAVLALQNPLDDLENDILDALIQVRESITQQIAEVEAESNAILGQIRGVPGQRRELLGIEREQQIKEQLYLYLLQKREETGLTQAVTESGLRIVENPIVEGPVGPASNQIYLLCLSLGFLLPVAGIAASEVLDTTIKSLDQLKQLTNVPVIGAIGTARGGSNIVVTASSRSAVAEMFRLVRTNLTYIGAHSKQKVILVTSSMSGEGKSFVSINLGLSLAISNKRVCVIGMDLRKPKLELYISDHREALGVSSYLVDENVSIGDIIKASNLHPNMDYIGCGPIPPNPAELLLSDRVNSLIQSLREDYDHIVIDSPPVGAVVDGFLIAKYIDATVYITRFGKTKADQLDILNEAVSKGQLTNPSVLLNGVKTGRGYYDYGNYYGKY